MLFALVPHCPLSPSLIYISGAVEGVEVPLRALNRIQCDTQCVLEKDYTIYFIDIFYGQATWVHPEGTFQCGTASQSQQSYLWASQAHTHTHIHKMYIKIVCVHLFLLCLCPFPLLPTRLVHQLFIPNTVWFENNTSIIWIYVRQVLCYMYHGQATFKPLNKTSNNIYLHMQCKDAVLGYHTHTQITLVKLYFNKLDYRLWTAHLFYTLQIHI